MACDDVVDRVHLPLGHVEIVPFESIAESLTLDAHVPFHSIIHVPEHCCLSSESAERRSIVTYEVFPFHALSIPICLQAELVWNALWFLCHVWVSQRRNRGMLLGFKCGLMRRLRQREP